MKVKYENADKYSPTIELSEKFCAALIACRRRYRVAIAARRRPHTVGFRRTDVLKVLGDVFEPHKKPSNG